MADDKDKKEKKDKDGPSTNADCIQPEMPPNAPEGSWFDWDTCMWRDSAGNPIGGGKP